MSGLSPGTYYYRLDVELNGNTYSGTIESFAMLAPAPTVTIGSATLLTSSRATASGAVTPNGTETSYVLEFGTSTAYGQSSAALIAGAGSAPVPASATLTGLRTRTRYHYRVVATNAGGTTVSGDRTFTTPAPPPPAPRFLFSVLTGQSLRSALAHRLLVGFTCNRACTAHFAVIPALPGKIRAAATPVSFATGTARLRRGSSGRASLRFTPSARSLLIRTKSIKLLITGYAIGSAGTAGAPKSAPLVLAR